MDGKTIARQTILMSNESYEFVKGKLRKMM